MKKSKPTVPVIDRALAQSIAPYTMFGRTVAFEQARAETDDILLFDAAGGFIGERPGRKPAHRAESAPERVTVRVKDQPVDGPLGVHRAGETFETTAAHAAILGKLVEAVPAPAATATQTNN